MSPPKHTVKIDANQDSGGGSKHQMSGLVEGIETAVWGLRN